MNVDADTLRRWQETVAAAADEPRMYADHRKTLKGLAHEIREAYFSALREELRAAPAAEGTGKT